MRNPRSSLVGSFTLLAASLSVSCFGAGPDNGPTPDDKAVLLGWAPDRTPSNQPFFGSAALDDTTVLVVAESGDTDPFAHHTAIWALAKDGTGKKVVIDGLAPSVFLARDATDIYWVEGSSCEVHRVSKAGGPATVIADASTLPSGPGTGCAGFDLVVDDAAIYVATGNGNGGGSTSVFAPCCDLDNHSQGQASALARIDKLSHAVTAVPDVTNFTCAVGRCIWADADTLYWFTQGGGVANVHGVPKGGGTPRNVLSLANRGLIALTPIPGGVAAASVSAVGSNGAGFVISTTQAGSSAALDVFTDNEHFCRDLATDGTSLYFTLISRSNNGEGGTTSGVGIGHIPLGTAAPAVQLLSIGRVDFIARRLLVGPTNMFLIDPFRVVSIPRTLVP